MCIIKYIQYTYIYIYIYSFKNINIILDKIIFYKKNNICHVRNVMVNTKRIYLLEIHKRGIRVIGILQMLSIL